MTSICHLFGADTGWQQRLALEHLLAHRGGERFHHRLMAVCGRARAALGAPGSAAEFVPQRRLAGPLAALGLGRRAGFRDADVVHAWDAAAAADARRAGALRVVLTCFDPRFRPDRIKRIRALADGSFPFAVACASQRVLRRLVEGGVAASRCVVIRPAVDFGLINRAKRGDLRARLGVERGEVMIVVPPPIERSCGALTAAWLVIAASILDPRLKLVVPGAGAEAARVRRLVGRGFRPAACLFPGDDHPFEELVSAADVLLLTPGGDDISVSSAAWAMAASVAVIGIAGYALAELVAHKHNGLLFKRDRDGRMMAQVASLLADRDAQGAATQTARAQAYDVFGLKRYADQASRLYDNLVAGREPSDGIVDSAVAA